MHLLAAVVVGGSVAPDMAGQLLILDRVHGHHVYATETCFGTHVTLHSDVAILTPTFAP